MNLEEWVNSLISNKEVSKKSVYDHLGVTQGGFLKMLRKETISLLKFIELCRFLEANPCNYINQSDYKELSIAVEPLPEHGKRKIVDIETKEFYERQIESLTRIIENLSEVVKSDTSINRDVTS